MPADIRSRIKKRLEALRKTPRAASLEAGMSADAIRGILRKKDDSPTVETIRRIARALKTRPEWLAFGIGAEQLGAGLGLAPGGTPVIGDVAAGAWREVDVADEPVYEPIPIPPDPRWPADAQFGLVVRGSSINNIAVEGDVLGCVDIEVTHYEPQDNDLVIVEQTRDGGALRERTAKLFRRKGRLVELWPDSSDKRWQEPIVFDPRQDSEGARVRVIAFVNYVHRPIHRAARAKSL